MSANAALRSDGAPDHAEDVGSVRDGRRKASLLEKKGEGHVADRKSHGGKLRSAEFSDQVVIAAAAGQRPQLPLAVERLEHESRVVGEAPDDAEIDLHEFRQPHRLKAAEELAPIGEARLDAGGGAGLAERPLQRIEGADRQECDDARLESRVERAERVLIALEGCVPVPLELVDGAEKRPDPGPVEAERAEEMEPEVAVAQPHADIVLRKAEGPHALDLEGDQLNLRLGPGLAEDVGIELEEAPAPALLHPLVAIEFGDAEPLDGTLQGARPLADQPADARRHLGPQGDLAFALVDEAKELRLNLITRLGPVKIQGLKDGCIVLHKPECGRGLPPDAKDVVSFREVLRVEIAKPGQGLEHGHQGRTRCRPPLIGRT